MIIVVNSEAKTCTICSLCVLWLPYKLGKPLDFGLVTIFKFTPNGHYSIMHYKCRLTSVCSHKYKRLTPPAPKYITFNFFL